VSLARYASWTYQYLYCRLLRTPSGLPVLEVSLARYAYGLPVIEVSLARYALGLPVLEVSLARYAVSLLPVLKVSGKARPRVEVSPK
jgi:hypothetical protein